jgi:WD40 repeat protein
LCLVKSWKFEFGPSSREIATGCYSIMFYDLDSQLLEKTLEINNESKYSYCLCYLNSDIFAVGNSNGSIFIYSKEQRKRINKIGENCLPIRSIAYDELNKRLLAASDDLHINIIDAERFNIIMPVVGHKDKISALAVNQELGIFASSSHDGTVKIWDNKQLKCIQTIDLHSHSNLELTNEGNIVWDISFSNSGKELICGSDTGCHILTLA